MRSTLCYIINYFSFKAQSRSNWPTQTSNKTVFFYLPKHFSNQPIVIASEHTNLCASQPFSITEPIAHSIVGLNTKLKTIFQTNAKDIIHSCIQQCLIWWVPSSSVTDVFTPLSVLYNIYISKYNHYIQRLWPLAYIPPPSATKYLRAKISSIMRIFC